MSVGLDITGTRGFLVWILHSLLMPGWVQKHAWGTVKKLTSTVNVSVNFLGFFFQYASPSNELVHVLRLG